MRPKTKEHAMDDETTTPNEQPTQPQPPEPKRLTRARDDRLIAGVCGGLGKYFGVDPVLFRVAAVALVFFGGAGVLLYLAAILLIPQEGEPGRNLRHVAGSLARVLGVLAICLALAIGGAW